MGLSVAFGIGPVLGTPGGWGWPCGEVRTPQNHEVLAQTWIPGNRPEGCLPLVNPQPGHSFRCESALKNVWVPLMPEGRVPSRDWNQEAILASGRKEFKRESWKEVQEQGVLFLW